MRHGYPTDDELRRTFESELATVSGGGGLRSGTGLDLETQAALIAIARAYPAITDDLISAARTAFAAQLDGTNAATRRAGIENLIAERNRRNGFEPNR
ncbi:hypothetical protein [Nocardia arthritidis]|uniref:Uncharacterized protein n=1 Tax=Nocardia arthritidis TaxID=228602 RepID=A0A6G9Y6Z8_9NOCA|nr:hypothetical protein [Nocardia arthritidis]QIS08991.1 hypothetical protein F5544_05395 [Nocardia arthritidis]